MEFFITGETYTSVGEKIRLSFIKIEPKINSLLTKKDYGEAITDWGHIIICCPPEMYAAGFFKEIKKYTAKKADLELRLRIDYELMLKANEKQTYALICESLLNGINIAQNELKVPDFNFTQFRNDLTTLFKKEGWI